MKHTVILLLACVSLLCGCSTARHSTKSTGALTVRIPSTLGFEASETSFRIRVDGRFVGNYNPDGTVLELPTGVHTVVAELPRAFLRFSLPNGGTEMRRFTLRGEERVELLGGSSKQSVIFNDDNLKSKEIEDKN